MAEDKELLDFGDDSPPKTSGRRQSTAEVGKGRRASLRGAPSPKRSGRRASLAVDESPKRMTRRASTAVANVRRASVSGSVAETLSQARLEMRRLSTAGHEPVIAPQDSLVEEAEMEQAVEPLLPDTESLAPAEALSGVQVRKPSDRAQAEESEGEKAAPKMPENGKLLQKTPLFARLALSDQALIFLVEHGEERSLRFSEVLYREGEKSQDWMGLVISGELRSHFHEPIDKEKSAPLLAIHPGMLFGELGALNICQARTATVAAEVDSKVLVIRSEKIWEAVHGFKDDVQRLTTECESWRAFMSSEVASTCHPEIMRHLREASVVRKLVPGEEHQLCVKQTRQIWAAAVIEHGEAFVKDSSEVVKAKDLVNISAALGINSSCSIRSHGGRACQITILDRVAFWDLILLFPKAKEAYTKWALALLPSATTNLSHIPMLQHLETSQSFFRALAGSIRQRVVPPRTLAVGPKDAFETLVFLQQGLADVIFHGHKVRELHAGSAIGDLNLLGLQTLSGITVVAADFCVLQDLRKSDLESHLAKFSAARSRWRELLKVRNTWKQDGAPERQIQMLRSSTFFGEDLSMDFMRCLQQQMEARIFFPEEKIQKDDVTGVLYLLCEGQIERLAEGRKSMLEVGAVVGDTGFIANVEGPGDELTAKTTCAVMVLYRMNMIDALKKHPEVKPHFESVTRKSLARQKSGNQEEGKEFWNIYRMSCFKDCSSRFLYLVDLHLERHIYFSDEVVVTENTEGEDMYILYSGVMDVQVKGIKVGMLEGGMFFGEMAVLGLVKKRSATIIAMTLCDARVLSRKSLEEAINEFPQELARFEELAATRNRMSLERRNGGRVRHLCNFFSDCKAEFAAAIADDMQDRLFTAGQVICKEGVDHASLFLIHQGAAVVSCEGKKVSELRSGDVCGELVAAGLTPVATATVTASETCFMQELSRESLAKALESFPDQLQQLRHLAALRMEWKHSVNELQMFEWVRKFEMGKLVEQLITRWIFFSRDEIVTQGQPGDSLFMISIGTAEVLHNDQCIRELGAGDVFGELCALGAARTRSSTVRCKDIADVYVLSKVGLDFLLNSHPGAKEALRALATVRMRSDVERMSEKHLLLHCPLFQQSSRKFLDRIAAHMEDRLFMEGEDLCKEGEKGDTMFILIQGLLDVFVLKEGGNVKVAELSAGSVIGEIAVLGLANQRTATLRAQQVSLVQVLHRQILMKYLNEFPREIATFQEVGASRLANTGVSKSTLFPQQLLFKDCSEDFLEQLCKQLQRKIIFPGQTIVDESAESQEMYAIAQGEAFVEKEGRRLGELQEGSAFGEMAVLGLMSSQSATIKAERMCDLQYLNSYDLETISRSFPEDRAKMLHVVATMMREELAEISDEEILREVPLLFFLGESFMKRLVAFMEVGVARKDEEICQAETMVVVLQGRAWVQIDGITVHELFEGESYGDASVLGLTQKANWNVKAASGSMCLYLYAKKELVQKVCKQSEGGRVCEHLRGPHDPDHREVLETCLKFMNLSEVQLDGLLELCEEGFCLAGQELLAARQISKNLLALLAGKAKKEGEEGVYEPGSLVYTNKELMPSAVVAVTHCKFLLLNKRILMKFIKAQAAEERDRLLQRLESMPGQARPTSLRQMSSHITKRCMQAAKTALKENKKPWEKPKVKVHPQREASSIGAFFEESPRRGASTKERRKRRRNLKLNELDQQEAMFCKEMQRLTELAKSYAEDAMVELKCLRREADELRIELRSLSRQPTEDFSPRSPKSRATRLAQVQKPRSARR